MPQLQEGGFYNTKSVTNFKRECALVSRIHVSFCINQQLARLCVAIRDNEMQSGPLDPRTENQKQISKNTTPNQ
jgi:hypothetical protein